MTAKGFPNCWLKIEVGEISLVISGGTPKANNPANFAKSGKGIAWITPADLSGYKKREISNGKRDLTQQGYDSCSAKFLPKDTILFSSRAPIGYVVIANNEMATNQGFKSFVFPEGVESDYAYYYFKYIVDLAKSVASGTTFKELSATKARKLPFLLPPLYEQKEIASKLEALFQQIADLKNRIDAIPNIIKQFRESVLSDAISGELTKDWRKENGITFWEINTFSDICKEITVGFVGKMSDKYKDSGIPFFRSQNIKPFKVSNKNLLYISEEFHKQIYKSRLEAGDLAIVRTGAPGTTCVIPSDLGDANCSDLVIARPDTSKLNSDYGCVFMNSELAKANVASNKVGVAQQHFNVGSMKKMSIILPPIEEQAEIVRHVEYYFSIANKIEQQLSVLQEKVNSLTPFILKKAFQGELTKDWRKNNPDLISGENSSKELLNKILSRQKELKQQTTKVKKRVKKMKITEETIKNTIAEMPKSFTFDDLREKIPAEYELLKNTVFSLLSMNPAFIEQFFDEESQMLRFKRLKQ